MSLTVHLTLVLHVFIAVAIMVMPMLFKSWRTVSIQFFLGLPGFRLALWSTCQYIACFGILLSSMRSTCPSHLSLLSLMLLRFISSSFVCCLTTLFRTLSFQDIPNSHRWNLWWEASSFFFCVTDRGHSCALYSSVDMTKDSYSLTLTFKLICLLFHISFSLPNTLLALPILCCQSLSQLPLQLPFKWN